MRRISHSTLDALLPEEESDYWRQWPIWRILALVSAALLLLLFSVSSYGPLFAAFTGDSATLVLYFLINIAGALSSYRLVKDLPETRRKLLAVGEAGFYASEVIDLDSYATYKDLFIDWKELRGLVVEYDGRTDGAVLRFYVEQEGPDYKLVQHQVWLSPFVGSRKVYPRVVPLIESICRHTGYSILFRCSGHKESTVLPSAETPVPSPWKCIFKAPAAEKRTWQF